MNAALLAPGSLLGAYRIQRLVASGASSQVYQACDAAGKAVAIKLLVDASQGRRGSAGGASSAQQATEAGMQALSTHAALRLALQHPNIVEALDGGMIHGWVWLAYEWVGGTDLSRYTQPAWLLPLPLVRDIGVALAMALDHAHRSGWLHRDLKPANVRVNLPRRVVKLTDFGISKPADSQATLTGVLQGTPTYMAPEQLLGEAPTARSDLYALGVLLYQLVSGHPPHEATTLQSLLQQSLHSEVPRLHGRAPDVPVPWTECIHRLLARDPRQRSVDARAVAQELSQLPTERIV